MLVPSILVVGLSLLIVVSVESLPSSKTIFERCSARSGLSNNDFMGYDLENEGCGLRCDTRQGLSLTYGINEGRKCSNSSGFKCLLGKCLGSDDTKADTSGLYNLNIRIKSAYVPDLDSAPGQGSSDVYVVIWAHKNASPSYNDGEHISHTYVIQDNGFPKWKNYVARPQPMRLSASLKFDLYDSDKPVVPDSIGYAIESVEYLYNRGPTKLHLFNHEKPMSPYYVEVEVTGKEYDPNDDGEWAEISP